MFAPVHPDCILTEEKMRATSARNEKRKSFIDAHVTLGKEVLETQVNNGKVELERRKSQLHNKLHHGKQVLEKRKSQLDSVVSAGLDRIDRGVDKMETQFNSYKETIETKVTTGKEKIEKGKTAFQKRKVKIEAKLYKGKKAVGKKVNQGLNWFFAIGTTEDETGQVHRATAEKKPKKVIKAVRFEE
jgi:chaperonin cofactor prefoldin